MTQASNLNRSGVSACGREALNLISTGERYALGARNGFTFEGAWVWKHKDFIDRCFMAKFNELAQMQAPGVAPVPAIAGSIHRRPGVCWLQFPPSARRPASKPCAQRDTPGR